jgi:hypothetical protein
MPNAKQSENPDIFTDLRYINVFLKKEGNGVLLTLPQLCFLSSSSISLT